MTTQATLPVPIDYQTPVRDLEDLTARVFAWARDVDNHLRVQPSVELLTVAIDPASLPLTVLVQTERVIGVARVKTQNQTTSAVVDDANLGWTQSSDELATGITISALDGCSAGTVYAVTLAVLGERG